MTDAQLFRVLCTEPNQFLTTVYTLARVRDQQLQVTTWLTRWPEIFLDVGRLPFATIFQFFSRNACHPPVRHGLWERVNVPIQWPCAKTIPSTLMASLAIFKMGEQSGCNLRAKSPPWFVNFLSIQATMNQTIPRPC